MSPHTTRRGKPFRAGHLRDEPTISAKTTMLSAVAAGFVVEVPTTGDQAKLRAVHVAVHLRGRELILRVLLDAPDWTATDATKLLTFMITFPLSQIG